MKEMLDAAAFAVSSPTLNNGLFSTICDFLVILKNLPSQKKTAMTFASYGL
jgi:flavorubredoxin